MKKALLTISITCSCFLQGQVWTSLVDSVPNWGWAVFHNTVEDTLTNTLYIGGNFQNFNQFKTKAIIKFNGTTFDTLQSGIDKNTWVAATSVHTMKMYKNKLYVFGEFARAGKYYNKYIARWNGLSWDSINFTTTGPIDFTDVYNNELYVGGTFDSIAGFPCNSIAKFDGTNWHPLSHPVKFNAVSGLKVFNNRLYIAGQVTLASSSANLSYWDGSQWVPWVGVSGDNNKSIQGLTVIDSMLWVYGRFNSIAGTNCKGLAAYNGKQWYGFGAGLSSSGWETVMNVQKINNEIYVCGSFDKIENTGNSVMPIPLTTNLAKFDGAKWCLISPPFGNVVTGLVKYNNNIYAHGAFRRIGNDSVWGFVKYNGGYANICSPTVIIKMSEVGLREVLEFGSLKIYPNPVKDKLNIQLDGFGGINISLELINGMAEILKTNTYTDGQNEFDLTDLPKGIYFLRVRDSETQKVFKVIKD